MPAKRQNKGYYAIQGHSRSLKVHISVQIKAVYTFCVISPNSIDEEADYITVVEDRPVRFGAEYPFPVIFWPRSSDTVSSRQLSFLFSISGRLAIFTGDRLKQVNEKNNLKK